MRGVKGGNVEGREGERERGREGERERGREGEREGKVNARYSREKMKDTYRNQTST